MIGADFSGVRNMVATVDRVGRASKAENERMNRRRATRFRKFAIGQLAGGSLNMFPLTALTKHIQAKQGISQHPPLHVDGDLARAMKARKAIDAPKPGSWKTGYLKESTDGPSDSKKTYTELANLHTTGYKIPLQGRKGQRVRNWFAFNFDVYFAKDKDFLTVDPRPFMGLAADKWISSGRDVAIIERAVSALQRLWTRK